MGVLISVISQLPMLMGGGGCPDVLLPVCGLVTSESS